MPFADLFFLRKELGKRGGREAREGKVPFSIMVWGLANHYLLSFFISVCRALNRKVGSRSNCPRSSTFSPIGHTYTIEAEQVADAVGADTHAKSAETFDV